MDANPCAQTLGFGQFPIRQREILLQTQCRVRRSKRRWKNGQQTVTCSVNDVAAMVGYQQGSPRESFSHRMKGGVFILRRQT